MKIKKIYTPHTNIYAQKRLILHNYELFEVKLKWDIFRLFYSFQYRFFGPKKTPQKYFYLNYFPFSKSDAFHTFNSIVKTKKNWMVTMEINFEYGNWYDDIDSYSYLQKDNCKYILAMSNYAKNTQLAILKDESLKKKIEDKIHVVYPPQTLFNETPQKITNNSKLKFIIVGASFFRKGGYETLKAFQRLHKEGYDLELTIVSSLDPFDYPEKQKITVLSETKKIIESSSFIKYYPRLENEKVLKLIENSNVGILASKLETFGYFVLECQAFGLPVITTTQRAFLETNSNERGWLINVPYDELGVIDLSSIEKRKNVSTIIENELYSIVKNIIENPIQIETKSANAISNIKRNHDLDKYKNQISNFYSAMV